jgi:hypothetical protein
MADRGAHDGPFADGAISLRLYGHGTDAGAALAASHRSYTPGVRQTQWAQRFDVVSGSADAVAAGLVDALRDTGATALNLRVHATGATPAEVLDQVDRLGADGLPAGRAAWAGTAR